jgi:hypothetical protein
MAKQCVGLWLAGARLNIAPNGWHKAWGLHQMAGARLEYCAEWQQMASAQESNNQMAIAGSRRPTEKIAARQSMDCSGQKKITAQQSGYWVGHKKNCAAVIDGMHWPKEQNSGTAITVSRRPKEKLRRSNQLIALAKRTK